MTHDPANPAADASRAAPVERGPTLLFVYNADSGVFNLLADVAHKMFMPATYPCRLCGLAYGLMGMHVEWTRFLDTIPLRQEFLHRDEYRQLPDHPDVPLPAILVRRDERIETLLDATMIDQIDTLAHLIDRVRRRLLDFHVRVRE